LQIGHISCCSTTLKSVLSRLQLKRFFLVRTIVRSSLLILCFFCSTCSTGEFVTIGAAILVVVNGHRSFGSSCSSMKCEFVDSLQV
jgi:hypothetical protein